MLFLVRCLYKRSLTWRFILNPYDSFVNSLLHLIDYDGVYTCKSCHTKFKKNKVSCHAVADKLSVKRLPMELWQLETVLLANRIWCYVSHITKRCILKFLICNKIVKATFAEIVEKPFQTPKFLFKSSKLIKRKLLLYRYLLKNQILNPHIFDRAIFSGFTIRNSTAKEDLNTEKQVPFYLITQSFYFSKNKTFGLFFMKKCTYKKCLLCKGFGILLLKSVSPWLIAFTTADMWHLMHGSLLL